MQKKPITQGSSLRLFLESLRVVIKYPFQNRRQYLFFDHSATTQRYISFPLRRRQQCTAPIKERNSCKNLTHGISGICKPIFDYTMERSPPASNKISASNSHAGSICSSTIALHHIDTYLFHSVGGNDHGINKYNGTGIRKTYHAKKLLTTPIIYPSLSDPSG